MKKNWYAVYTKSHCEKKVTAFLSKKKIENYCPLNKIVNVCSNNKKINYEPLFPSFVFVYATDAEISVISENDLIINFVYWLGKRAIIRDAEIENIQYFTQQYSNISIEKTVVNTKGFVRIITDPTVNWSDNILSSKKTNFKLLLPSLGYIMTAEIEKPIGEVFNYGFEKSKMVF